MAAPPPPTHRRAASHLVLGLLAAAAACCAPPAWAAGEADIAEMRRALQELQTQNRESRRITTLEAEAAAAGRRRRSPAPRPAEEAAPAPAALAQPPTSAAAALPPPQPGTGAATPAEAALLRGARGAGGLTLEQRVRDLEVARIAQEGATRSIIRDALTTVGAQINQNIALGGALEFRAGRFGDFRGPHQEFAELSTAELDFDIRINEWIHGSMILGFDPGVSGQQPSFGARPTTGVDRFRLDRGTITIGDVQRFPIYARMGRDVLAFGTSTGLARVDTLSLSGPLSVEAFESRQEAFGIGFALPTPALAPAPPPVVIPPVEPLVLGPLVESGARLLGWSPPPVRLQPLRPFPPPPVLPAFYGSVYAFNGNQDLAPGRRLRQNINASLGYRTEGSCGQRFEELRDSWLCPWSADFRVDFVSSVFDSNFLSREYAAFLAQIGQVPGIAASLRSSLGPFSLVAEYNTAVRKAVFLDDTGRRIGMLPAAWQVSLAYQFDWNPWVEKIGEQGTFVALTYSGTKDLQGATELQGGTPTRVGFLPQTRLALTLGEWVMPGLRLAAELSGNWDYGRKDGGTGNVAGAFVLSVLYTF